MAERDGVLSDRRGRQLTRPTGHLQSVVGHLDQRRGNRANIFVDRSTLRGLGNEPVARKLP